MYVYPCVASLCMLLYVTLLLGDPSGCRNNPTYAHLCDEWAGYGECANSPEFMRIFCPVSCRYCETTTGSSTTTSSTRLPSTSSTSITTRSTTLPSTTPTPISTTQKGKDSGPAVYYKHSNDKVRRIDATWADLIHVPVYACIKHRWHPDQWNSRCSLLIGCPPPR